MADRAVPDDTVVVRRSGLDVAWYEGDRWFADLVAAARPGGPAADTSAVALPAELRRVVTMAEPRDPSLTDWLLHDVGGGRISVGDAWGQVQLGGIVSVDHAVRPEALPDPGFAILDADGGRVADGRSGELVLERPWAGTLRAMEGAGAGEAAARHWRRPGVYCTDDLARRRQDGSLDFLGRIDEVVSVSGQLVSLGEVRDVLLDHPFVVAADVVERADARLGRSLAAAVVVATDVEASAAVARDLLDIVRDVLGGLARPRALLFVDRFGDELSSTARRRALATLAASVGEEPLHVTWHQVLAAAPRDEHGPR